MAELSDVPPVARRFYTLPWDRRKVLIRDELETRFANLASWAYASLKDGPDRTKCIEALELAAFHGRNAIKEHNGRAR